MWLKDITAQAEFGVNWFIEVMLIIFIYFLRFYKRSTV